MYRRRGRQSDFELAVKKFLEHNRDPARRLKALKHAEGTSIAAVYIQYSPSSSVGIDTSIL